LRRTSENLLDDGQFAAAYVMTAFDYDRAENIGIDRDIAENLILRLTQ